jgi:radical SAM protein with 4Fe4S-binding SPASM domain
VPASGLFDVPLDAVAPLAPTDLGWTGTPEAAGAAFPHIVAWNLTRRCNLACAHCYISAGDWHGDADELDTEACRAVIDQILAVNSTPVLILSGGEPLLREDLEILAERAASRGATVVVGTNGVRLTESRIRSLQDAGVTGVAVSVDSLDPTYHDRFRLAFARPSGGRPRALPTVGHDLEAPHAPTDGRALEATLAAVERCREAGLDFVIQTTVTRGNRGELGTIAAWAADRGAVSFNVYFLVATGRGDGMRGLSPAENDAVLEEIVELERTYRGRMLVRSKCQPQLMRHVIERSPDSPLLNYQTRCPCGVHYARITPEGKVTPCPYSPLVAGDLRTSDFGEIWRTSEVFRRLRSGELHGKCGRCEYRKVCGGCRARALAETGDVLGPDDSCAYEPVEDAPVVEPRAVAYGRSARTRLRWTDEAKARVERIPSFVRGVVTARVETFAEERGYAVVDEDVMAEVRRSLPVDFSKRLPFFLRNGGDA